MGIKGLEDIHSKLTPENIKVVTKNKSVTDKKNISNCLKHSYVFYALEFTEKEAIINEMEYCETDKGQFIFR